MTNADRYVKIVEWSEEDGVFVGQCPGVIGPCCHGLDEVEVYRQLSEIVSEWLELVEQDGPSRHQPPVLVSPRKSPNNSRQPRAAAFLFRYVPRLSSSRG